MSREKEKLKAQVAQQQKELEELKRRMLARELKDFDQDVKHLILQAQVIAQGAKLTMLADEHSAMMFVIDQITQRTVRIWFMQSAITLANNDLHAILQTKKSESVDVLGIVMFAAFTVAPEFAGLAVVLKELRDADRATVLIQKAYVQLAKVAGKSYDATQKIPHHSGPSQQAPQALEAANEVLRDLYNQNLEGLNTAATLQSILIDMIQNKQILNPYTQIQTWWKNNDLAVLKWQDFHHSTKNADILRKKIVYDMLRAYATKYLSIEPDGIDGRVLATGYRAKSKTGWLEVADLDDLPLHQYEVDGLNDNQEKELYRQLSNLPFNEANRPPIRNFRDLIRHWGLPMPMYMKPKTGRLNAISNNIRK